MLRYRSEIDGLRALAVVSVILFHAGFSSFSGGFVGVDVFFVISGYLITTIIVEDIENKKFSIVNFYERRARRILPALFFVMLCCIPFSFAWMLQNQIRDFSQSLVAVSLFASNILFWRESGYFAAAADEKPLLHTWSLAVEEQYYVLFPIFLFLTWRFGRRSVFWMIVVFAAISLALSEWGWRNMPTANFYLAPTRVWEILSGSIAAFLVYKNGVRKNNTFSILGLLLILFSIFFYDESTPFPSLYATVPILGVVLVVLYADRETIAAKLLSAKLFVGVGLISYSAYLWHQPLFAFARIRDINEYDGRLMMILSVMSLVLAYFSWRFVEVPFRNREVFTSRAVVLVSTTFFSALLCVGVLGHKTNGFESLILKYRFSPEQAEASLKVVEAVNYDIYDFMYDRDCSFWKRNIDEINMKRFERCHQLYGGATFVLGDSHAMNLYNIIAKSRKIDFVIGVAQGGCRPHKNLKQCHYDSFDRFLGKNSTLVDRVIYHQSGSYFITDKNGREDTQLSFEGGFSSYNKGNIKKTSDYLEKMSEKYKLRVLWIGPFLEFRYIPLRVVEKAMSIKVNPNSIDIFNSLDSVIADEIGGKKTYKYVPFKNMFAQPIKAYQNKCFIFRDPDHYSRCGEDFISGSFDPSILFKNETNISK